MNKVFITNLKCEYLYNPVGIDTPKPRLSWNMESNKRGQHQVAYRILVSSSMELLEKDIGDFWDTGRIELDLSANILYEGRKMKSCCQYFWKVAVWDHEGYMHWSNTAFWEMGFLSPNDWKAHWISSHNLEKDRRSPFFRKEISTEKTVNYARAYICGLGYYEFYINGNRIGDHVLDPAQTDYEKRAFYSVYDITSALCPGKNALGVILGDGWYNQNRVWRNGKMSYGKPRLILQILVAYTDGSLDTIITDSSWKTTSGPIISNNIYEGEIYDARLEMKDWSIPGFDHSNWEPAQLNEGPGGILTAQIMPAIKVMKIIKPIKVTNVKSGVYVVDMGQNFAGWARIKVSEKEGTRIQLKFAETLYDDGMINTLSTGVFATNVEQTDVYICRGDEMEIWEPRFTYHGFRYIEVTGLTVQPSLESVEGIVVYSSVDTAGSFECSDETMNRIHRAALWTEISNLHSVPTDCPARERCGWLGDAQITAEMTIYNFDMVLFWEKYLQDIETSRNGGMPYDIAPGKRLCLRGIPDWSTAFIQIPWYVYLYYGNKSVLEEHYEGMRLVIETFRENSRDWILYEGRGDWCPPGSIVPIETPPELTSSAFFYLDTCIMSRVAMLLGHDYDADRYRGWAGKIKDVFIKTFYDESGNTYGSQTADAFALYLGLVPDGREKILAASLADNVSNKHGGHLSTGIIGSRHLYWALSNYGYSQVARGILNKKTYPSIGFMFKKGATTIWENYEEVVYNERQKAYIHKSMNHPMQGGFDAWFYQGMAGINPDCENPGFKRFILKPQLIEGITYVNAQYRCVYGLISSRIELIQNKLNWKVSIPANTSALVYFPTIHIKDIEESNQLLEEVDSISYNYIKDGYVVCEVLSGNYSFSIELR